MKPAPSQRPGDGRDGGDGLVIDPQLLARYDSTGPRYTSYPTAVRFSEAFAEAEYLDAVRESHQAPGRPLSLYFHIPFCATLCFYCACNKIVTKRRERAVEYLQKLYLEIALQARQFSPDRPVTQLHLGGGTPTFLSTLQIGELLDETGRRFNLASGPERDFSIEIDPRTVSEEGIDELYALGFNRLSLGVQDFDPEVQRAVHRIQSESETLALLERARATGFRSINIDLIYGLPRQSETSFARTLETIIASAPDRLSVFNYAHLPAMFAPQRRISEDELPSADEKLRMLRNTVEQLTRAGYVYIGMDHFARPDDELVRAKRRHTLHRNFQGYASHADCDLVGLGVTSIGKVGSCYSQNTRTLDDYYERVTAGHIPITRGIRLAPEDRLRREIIDGLMCYGEVDFAGFETRHGIDFRAHFADELERLEVMQADGLVSIGPRSLTVLPRGRFLVRNVSMVFDQYLDPQAETKRFSRLV